jgi:acyl homoserine lactone synthase
MTITIDKQSRFDLDALAQMYRLRAKIFGERMGWEVAVLSGMEIDEYDAQSPHYMIMRDIYNEVCGCWRLLPTEGPYMLRNTFPQLLYSQNAPVSPRIWELSRFAVVSREKTCFGFGQLALDAMRAVVVFADRHAITHYVTVTTTGVERLLQRAGIATRRYGPPIRIGNADALALSIDLGEQTHEALFRGAESDMSAYGGFEQSLGATHESAARLIEPERLVHFASQPDALGHGDPRGRRTALV